MSWQHVLPINDLIEHETEGFECQCNPKIDFKNEIVIHSAIDRRECFEQSKDSPFMGEEIVPKNDE